MPVRQSGHQFFIIFFSPEKKPLAMCRMACIEKKDEGDNNNEVAARM